MSRDSSGNYTLPPSNPVVPGTTITSSWANLTLDDIAQALTDSLDRNGRGGMLAPFRFVDGTVAQPGASWTQEPSTGLARPSVGLLSVSVLATQRFTFGTTSNTSTQPLALTNGGLTVSNIASATHRGVDILATAGATKWALRASGGAQSWLSGRVGIGEGAETPTTNLQVAGDQASVVTVQVQNDSAVANASAAFQARIAGGNAVNLQANPAGSTGQPVTGGALGAGLFTTSGLTAGLALGTTAGPVRFFSESVSVERMRLDGPNLGIGTAAPAGLLHVQGTTDALTRMRLQNAGGAAPSVIDQTTGGLELFAAGMNTTNRYTPALRFGSTDPDFTTTNPKTMAAIVGYATQTFSADGTSGMGLEFFTSPNSQVTPVLQSRMTIDQNGAVNVPGAFSVSTGQVTSGTFAPTGFAGANVSALTVSDVQWMRVGNVVTVSGQVTPTFTAAANTVSAWTMTLPVPSALGFVRRLAGTAAAQGTATFSTPAAIFADTANDRASFRCLATATGAVGFSFHYTYLIL